MMKELYMLLKNIFDSHEENIIVGCLTKGGLIARFEIDRVALRNEKLVIECDDTFTINTINHFSQGLGCIDISLPSGLLTVIYE